MSIVAVLDTNILLSAIVYPRGNPFVCLDAARQRRIESVTCDDILEEFFEKLVVKFYQTQENANQAVTEVRGLSRVVVLSGGTYPIVDLDDSKILDCAIVASATHIVTGDKKHLLPLNPFRGVRIVTPAEFLRIVEANEPTAE